MKTLWKINKLHEWKDNPRSIKKKDFERLKKQTTKLGQYKPPESFTGELMDEAEEH